MMNINLVERKLVKPSSPTPPNLRSYKISFTDEFLILREMEAGVVLFYASNRKQAMLDFEESLSKALVQFYPLAGRYVMKDRYVDCSDQGAELVGASAPDVELATLITERDLGNLAAFFPRKADYVDEATYPLLSIQVTQLKCGGVVIGISVSHKIFDASSLGTFIAAWSSACRLGNTSAIIPTLGVSSAWFPLKSRNNLFPDSETLLLIADTSRVCVKRFTFNKAAIGEMRSKLRPREGNRAWSRVRVVSSFIAKALIGVDRIKRGGISRPCQILQVVNIRERTVPPLPKHSCGNLVFLSFVKCVETDEIGKLADAMSKGIDRCVADCAQLLCVDEDGVRQLMVGPLMKAAHAYLSGAASDIVISDCSKFGWYEADFGWGKPVWVTIIPLPVEREVVLLENAEGDGIEGWVHLDTNDMPLFEQDEDIKMFANISMHQRFNGRHVSCL